MGGVVQCGQLSKLPTRQLTIEKEMPKRNVFSKLPTRQLTLHRSH